MSTLSACPGATLNWFGRGLLGFGVAIELDEFRYAKRIGDKFGMADALLDIAAMTTAVAGGVYGLTFSMSYAVSDNLLSPAVRPVVTDGYCLVLGGC